MAHQVKLLVTQFLDLAESWDASAALGLQLLASVSAVLQSCDAAGSKLHETAPSLSKILDTLEPVETFRLHEYVTQKSWSGRPNGASLQQLMDSLAGLQSTLKLLQESSKALLQVSLQAEQVAREILTSRDSMSCNLRIDSQDPLAEMPTELGNGGGDDGGIPWLWASNAALCMTGFAEGVQQCTTVMERIAEEVGPDTPVDRMATLTLMWDLQPYVCPKLKTFLQGNCDT